MLIENKVVVDDEGSKFNVRYSIPIYLMFCFSRATSNYVESPFDSNE